MAIYIPLKFITIASNDMNGHNKFKIVKDPEIIFKWGIAKLWMPSFCKIFSKKEIASSKYATHYIVVFPKRKILSLYFRSHRVYVSLATF